MKARGDPTAGKERAFETGDPDKISLISYDAVSVVWFGDGHAPNTQNPLSDAWQAL